MNVCWGGRSILRQLLGYFRFKKYIRKKIFFHLLWYLLCGSYIKIRADLSNMVAARDGGVDDSTKAAYALVDADAILKMSSSANLSNDDVLISKK